MFDTKDDLSYEQTEEMQKMVSTSLESKSKATQNKFKEIKWDIDKICRELKEETKLLEKK